MLSDTETATHCPLNHTIRVDLHKYLLQGASWRPVLFFCANCRRDLWEDQQDPGEGGNKSREWPGPRVCPVPGGALTGLGYVGSGHTWPVCPSVTGVDGGHVLGEGGGPQSGEASTWCLVSYGYLRGGGSGVRAGTWGEGPAGDTAETRGTPPGVSR